MELFVDAWNMQVCSFDDPEDFHMIDTESLDAQPEIVPDDDHGLALPLPLAPRSAPAVPARPKARPSPGIVTAQRLARLVANMQSKNARLAELSS